MLTRGPVSADGADDLRLTLWTADPLLAGHADAAGIDRIGIDLERRGKAARQHGLGSWISDHDLSALAGLRPVVQRARLFARCDPPDDGTATQVDDLLAAGVQVLMLPMYRTAAQVAQFVEAVDGRARTVLLLETREAVRLLSDRTAMSGVDELHVGLNDLALALGHRNRFTMLADPLLDRIARDAAAVGLPLGVGGIGRPSDRSLPLPGDLVQARIAALGATGTLLSRSFLRAEDPDGTRLARDVAAARERHAWWRAAGPVARAAAGAALRERAERLARARPALRTG